MMKKQLGAKFDLRQIHEVVLTNGPVPLDILEQLADALGEIEEFRQFAGRDYNPFRNQRSASCN